MYNLRSTNSADYLSGITQELYGKKTVYTETIPNQKDSNQNEKCVIDNDCGGRFNKKCLRSFFIRGQDYQQISVAGNLSTKVKEMFFYWEI